MKRDPQVLARRARQLRFHRMVQRVSNTLPSKIQEMLHNVAIVVQDEPSESHGTGMSDGRYDVLGLYRGVPMIERGSGNLLLPDQIAIFSGPISRHASTRSELEAQIRVTLLHEIGHHLGFDEYGLERIGLG